MTPKKLKNYRLPDVTLDQLQRLKEQTTMTEVQIVIMAIDRLAQQELPKPKA